MNYFVLHIIYIINTSKENNFLQEKHLFCDLLSCTVLVLFPKKAPRRLRPDVAAHVYASRPRNRRRAAVRPLGCRRGVQVLVRACPPPLDPTFVGLLSILCCTVLVLLHYQIIRTLCSRVYLFLSLSCC